MKRPGLATNVTLTVTIVVLAAYGGGESAGDDLQTALQQYAAQIDELIGRATCTTTGQCRVMAVGAKPCGGPAGHRVYSTVDTNEAVLQVTLEQFNALSAELNRRTGAISDCTVVTKPPVACVSGTCVTQ